MYSIWIRNVTLANSQEVCIYNDESTFEEYKLGAAKLSLEEGSAGSLTIAVPKTNIGYDQFEVMATVAVVRKRTQYSNDKSIGDVYWIGRLLSSSEDFYGTKTLKFEGAYNYFMDTIQLQYYNGGNSGIVSWLNMLILNHNKQVIADGEYYKIIKIGGIDSQLEPNQHPDLYTDYETTLDCINNIIEGWEGHLSFQYTNAEDTSYTYTEGGTTTTVNFNGESYHLLTISIYKDYDDSANMPEIIFGENLTDYTNDQEADEIATVIIPRGARYDDEGIAEVVASFSTQDPEEDPNHPPIDGLDYYTTIWKVNNHSIYLTADQAQLNRFGLICKTIDFDLTEKADLLAAGQKYMQDQKWINTSININAIDARLLGKSTDEIKIGRMVHCVSEPHGLDYNYPCISIEEDLMDVSGTTYKLGIKDESYLTSSARKTDDKLKNLVLDSIRRERLLATNASDELDNTVNNSEIFTTTQLYQTVYNRIDVQMNAAIDTATGFDKDYIVNTLNIFDNDLNPNNKGYVHFVTEKRDYSMDENVLTLADLKARVNTYFPDTTTYSSKTLSDFWTHLETYMDDENCMVVVLLGSNLYETAIGIFGNTQGTVDGHKVPYYNTPTYTRYTSPAKYFVNGDSTYYHLTRGGFKSKTASSCRFSCATSGQFWYSSETSTCNKATPAFSSMNNSIPGDILPNDLTFSSNNYTVYCNRDIYTNNLQSIWRNKNFYKSLTPNPKDHITEIVISDDLDYTQSTSGVWRWNKLGLYFLENGYSTEYCDDRNGEYSKNNNTVRVGITRDGQIVADRISVGILNAGIVKAGYLTSQDYGQGTPETDASFILDIESGTMLSKYGTLLFNGTGTGSDNIISVTNKSNDFVYLSNKKLPGYVDVAGQISNEWMFILGSSFGIDRYGRAYMREGIIGATGGVWDLMAYNVDFITTKWINDLDNPGTCRMVWTFELNTTAARPVLDSRARTNSDYCFWFRLARYNNGNLEFLTNMSDRIFFEAGNAGIDYKNQDFYPPVTYVGNLEDAPSYKEPYYKGEPFPVFYKLDDETSSSDYVIYDGHKYVQWSLVRLEVTGYLDNDPTKPQYVNYSNHNIDHGAYVDTTNSGAVYIGSGYIYNGSIGSNASFSLSAINRAATISVSDGAGHNTTTRDDWRLTVGSKFAVTDDGTLFCSGAHMRNVDIDTTVSANYVDTSNVGGVILNATQVEDGTEDDFTFTIDASFMGSTLDASVKMWLSSATSYNSATGATTIVYPEPNSGPPNYIPTSGASSIPQTNMYDDVDFNLRVYKWYSKQSSAETTKYLVGSFNFSYKKNTQTGYSGANPQMFYMGDISSWFDNKTDQQGNIWVPTTLYETEVTVTNERSGDLRPTWVLSGYTGSSGTTGYSFGGSLIMAKQNADTTRPAMNVARRDIIGSSSSLWIGGPGKYWGHSYIRTMHYNDTVQGRSSYLYKNTIEPLTDIYDTIFDELRPVSYYMNETDNHVKHTGFIMEEIGEILENNNIDPELFGAYAPNKDGKGGSLCYLDFIAILTRQVQKLKQKVKQLEERCKVEKDENSSDFEASE